MFKPLSEITVGTKAIIRTFENEELQLKLMEMGCIPGEIVVLEKTAPLKDPISILVSGYSLSLRLNEAKSIIVEELI
jgi:ferrous iron transport protein A